MGKINDNEVFCELHNKAQKENLEFRFLILKKLKEMSDVSKSRGDENKVLKRTLEHNTGLMNEAIRKIDAKGSLITNLKVTIFVLVFIFGYLIYGLTTKIDENHRSVVIARKIDSLESKTKKRRIGD